MPTLIPGHLGGAVCHYEASITETHSAQRAGCNVLFMCSITESRCSHDGRHVQPCGLISIQQGSTTNPGRLPGAKARGPRCQCGLCRVRAVDDRAHRPSGDDHPPHHWEECHPRRRRGRRFRVTYQLFCALHSTTLRYATLHCTTLHCAALRCAALRCAALHCTALHCTALHRTALHST
eukprot:gene15834-biopygen274